MRVSQGMIVLYRQPTGETTIHGTRLHPAIVTGVEEADGESIESANLLVFFNNGGPPMWKCETPYIHDDPTGGLHGAYDFIDHGSPSSR